MSAVHKEYLMEFTVKSGHSDKQRSACVVVGVFDSRQLSKAAAQLDAAGNGFLTKLLDSGDMDGRAGQTLMLTQLPKMPKLPCERVLLIGCGPESDFNDRAYRKAVTAMTRALGDSGATEAVSYLSDLDVKERDTAWRIREGILTANDNLYRFDQFKSKKDERPRPLQSIAFAVSDQEALTREAEEAQRIAAAIGKGVKLARDLGNLPGNVCTPTYLAEQATTLAGNFKTIKTEILSRPEMEALGMGSLLSVARGSREEPKLIVMQYQGGGDSKPIALVGKGITFDTGGISIKPAQTMDEMKYDMCGAASVLGTLQAVAELGLPLNVVGIIPSCENMPDGAATKPGDIVTSMSGQTIEILNTDAEGRLILCDALTYSERFEPDAVIDIATLTGACIIALGHLVHGLMGNDDPLVQELLSAGRLTGDRAWELPLHEEYQEALDSNFADVANVGDRAAGTITAASFLSRFTKTMRWAHLDIAGTAWKSGKEKSATGRPVPLLTEFLIQRAARA
jgi:leucyl aminopeptidase